MASLTNDAKIQRISSFVWGIADDVLRDIFVKGKYRDIILPFTVLRRLDLALEPTKQQVLDLKETLDAAGIVEQDAALRTASGQAFWNTSSSTMGSLRSITNQERLRQNFLDDRDGYSPHVQRIIENFEIREKVPKLVKADALGALIEKYFDKSLDLSPESLDNHAMGTVFEDLVRKFNEANNEEAGEHWTPRDAVKLMARLIFDPIANQIPDGTYTLYDGAMGTGGMLTVAEETLQELAEKRGKRIITHLYGQEISAETYAIALADLLLKGEGANADGIIGGPEYSTLSNDQFAGKHFDFLLSNPPYGKSWKTDLGHMGGKKGILDKRFIVEHAGDSEYSLVTRSSDGQMLFLANMVAKMKQGTPLGSRIAEVHNGSSLFTGDAGQGESNIRRYIIENDWLEAIIALPLNMFYNTGIATYIWVLASRKEERRRGKVQLIDATSWYTPLRRNLGSKNRELQDADVGRIMDAYHAFDAADPDTSKVFANEDFGYWKVTLKMPDGSKDTEQVPLNEPGGIDAFIEREVLPYEPNAKVDPKQTKIGYEINFNKHFYKPVPLRTLDEIRADIRALEAESDDLIAEILGVE
jgi:type I restriction enzyme M protein